MSRRDSIRLGVVQPRTYVGSEARRNLEDAVGYIAAAAEDGIDLLAFPETYPGPATADDRYDIVDELARAARDHGVDVVAGTTVETDGGHHVSEVVIDRTGTVRGYYHRSHPRAEVYFGLYSGGPFWDIRYQPGDELPVFDMGWGVLGVGVCSEIYVPEVARTLGLQGAEVCVFPTGIMIEDLGFTETWRTMVRARAIENLMYTATSMNLFDAETRAQYAEGDLPPIDPRTGVNRGHAIIAGPDRVLALSDAPGILAADLDLARARLMRESPEFPDGVVVPPPFATIPGVFRLRRPELA